MQFWRIGFLGIWNILIDPNDYYTVDIIINEFS